MNMNKEIKKLNNLIYSLSKETQIMDNMIPELHKNSKVLNKLLAKVGLYKIKNNFSYFDLTLSERQKIFHLCNRSNYYIRNIMNLLLKLNKKYSNENIMEKIFNILIICVNKSEEIKRITICVLDKYGFKQRSDNKINNIDTKIIEFDLVKMLEDDDYELDDDDDTTENSIYKSPINKENAKNVNKENPIDVDDYEECSFIENDNENENDKDVNKTCIPIKKEKI